jgi:uncharacterized protein YicC (UPF0701 family)
MTGFANQSVAVGEWNLSLECKSVNSRFLDLTLKLPDVVKRSEPALRQLITEKLVRGKGGVVYPHRTQRGWTRRDLKPD